MGQATGAFGFLTGSENRITVLTALRDGPTSPADLRDRLELSRVTLWRVLEALEQRGWVRGDDRVGLTTRGELIADALGDFERSVAASARLDGLLEHLPTESFTFPVRRLADARIVRPTRSDPTAHMRAAADISREAGTVRVLSHALAPPVLTAFRDRVLAGEQTVEMVLTEGVLDAMAADPDAAGAMQDLLETDDAAVYQAERKAQHRPDATTGMSETGEQEGRFLVTHADDDAAVLQDVEGGGIHTLAENPGLERHDVLDATLVPEPPMEVVWSVAEIDDQWSVSVERSPERPTAQTREMAADEVGELVTRERAGEGELHVVTVPSETTDEAAADVVEDGATLTRAARMGVRRVEVRAADGVVSVRYLP